MPKLDVRGQQSATPGVQQIEAAYGGGMAAAQLKISDGLGKVAKAGVEAIDFFDMQGEAEAQVEARKFSLEADAKLREIDESPDIPAVGREKAYTDWAQGEVKTRGKSFAGSGARYWERAAGDVSDKGTIQARNSAQRSALGKVRSGLMESSDILIEKARLNGNVSAIEMSQFNEELAAAVDSKAMTEDSAMRLRLTTAASVRANNENTEELRAGYRILDSVTNLVESDPDANWSEIREQLKQNEDFKNVHVRQAVEADAKARFNQIRLEQEQEAKETYASAQMAFIAEPGTALAIANGMSPEEGVRFMAWQKSWTGFQSIQSDPNTFNEIIAQMTSADPERRAAFLNRDLMLDAGNLSQNDFNRFQSLQKDEDSETFDFLGGELSSFEALARSKYPKKYKTASKRAALKQKFSLLYLNASIKKGEPLTPPESLALMQRALVGVAEGGIWDSPAEPAINLSEEDIERFVLKPGPKARAIAESAVAEDFPELKPNSPEYQRAMTEAVRAYLRTTIGGGE